MATDAAGRGSASGSPRLTQPRTHAPDAVAIDIAPAKAAASSTAATAVSVAIPAAGTAVVPAAASPPGLTTEHAVQALQATFAQRGTTHLAAHAGAWVSQVAAVATAAGLAGASGPVQAATSMMVGGGVSAVLKEVVGEHMKTNAAHSATIDLPNATTAQRVGPQVMAGANDMWTNIVASMGNAAIHMALKPAIQQALQRQGLSQEAAAPIALLASAAVQRLVSATADVVSDMITTAMKAAHPAAQGAHKVNERYDTATAVGGSVTRLALNYGLTLPVGAPVALGKLMENGTPAQKAAASSALAWAAMNGWIVAKTAVTDVVKKAVPSWGVTPTRLDGRNGQPLATQEVELQHRPPRTPSAHDAV